MSSKELARSMTFKEWQEFMAEFLRYNDSASKAWDVITCQRGPDSPSERPDMGPAESAKAYKGRRERKYNTVEVIRAASFGGVVGGAARSHKADKVVVPPPEQRDHFDRHVVRAAGVLGLKVEVSEK